MQSSERAFRLNSLPAKLLGLFVLVLMGTVALAFGIGLRAAERGVESEIKGRTSELAAEVVVTLRRAGTDDNALSDELAATIRRNRGQVLRAELARGNMGEQREEVALRTHGRAQDR